MKTIEQRWQEFAAVTFNPGTPLIQVKEMRRAFYAGVHVALMAGVEIAAKCGENADAGATMLERMHRECRTFAHDVAAGRA